MQAMKLPVLITMQAMKMPAPPQDQIILISMVLVYLLSLLLVFVYFLHITLSPKIKKIINEKQDQPPKRLRVFKKPL